MHGGVVAGGRRNSSREGDASGMHGAECFVPYLSLTPVRNPCWRACCAEYFSRTAPGRWSVIVDFAATSWGVGARACVMKIGSLFRYGYPCRGIRASVHRWTWGISWCLGLYTRSNEHASSNREFEGCGCVRAAHSRPLRASSPRHHRLRVLERQSENKEDSSRVRAKSSPRG